MTSQKICEANVSFANGGKAPLCSPGCSVCAFVALLSAIEDSSHQWCGEPHRCSAYSANRSRSAISSEKMPSASVTANPKIRLPNWPCAADGLRSAAARYWPKIAPTPTPAPPMPMQAMPAPMYFAATGSMWKLLFEVVFGSVARVDRIVEIDAGEDGEHVGLQEGDQQLERGERDHHAERQHATDCTEDAEACGKQRNEAGEDLQGDVAGQHVREETNAVRDRAQQKREHLDEH